CKVSCENRGFPPILKAYVTLRIRDALTPGLNELHSLMRSNRVKPQGNLMSDVVLTEVRGSVHWIIINRIERRNALNEQVANAITAGVDAAEADANCRAIVLTGAGDKAFCAGGDLAPSATGAPFTVNAADPRNFIVRMLKRMSVCTLPIIARVNG